MPLTIAQRRARIDLKEKQMKMAVNLRAEGKTWYEVAELIGVNSHQRAQQIHTDAVMIGIKPQLTSQKKGG